MPSSTIAGSAIHRFGAKTTTTDIAACTSVPPSTKWSRLKRWRQRGNYSAATIAPPPRQASISV